MPRIHNALRHTALVGCLLVAAATHASAQLPGSILGPGNYTVSNAQITFLPFSLNTGFYWQFDSFARPCHTGPTCPDVGVIGHNIGSTPSSLSVGAGGSMSFWSRMTFVFSQGPLSWSNSTDAPPTQFSGNVTYMHSNPFFQQPLNSFFDVFIDVDIQQTGFGAYTVATQFRASSSAGGLLMQGNSSFQLTCTDCVEEDDDEITVTPEPISMALLGTGLLGMGGAKWRSRRRREDSEDVS